MTTLYLASKSPRRKLLLQQLGIEFEIIHVDIAENPAKGEAAIDYVQRIAMQKAIACRQHESPHVRTLAADTEVVLDNRILGKPADMHEAIMMLQSLSGRDHMVHTAVVLLSDSPITVLSTSRVWFKPLTSEECVRYCQACQPLDKAGAYGIQDMAAGFICRFEGSYSGVMGLPLAETAKMLGLR